MGMNLFDEFADHSPDELTPRERWVGGVLAKDANDASRVTFHSVVSDVILRKARVNQREMYKILARLQDAKVLEKVTSGYTSQTAKYRFLSLRSDWVSSSDTQSGEGVQNEHPQAGKEGVQNGSERVSDPGREGVQTGLERVSNPDTPTPYAPPSPPSSPPRADGVSQVASGEGEGGGEAPPGPEDEQWGAAFAALAGIVARHPRLAMGEREIEALTDSVRVWLERATPAHMEEALTKGLPPEISSPVGFVRRRLVAKLPPPRASVPASARGQACRMCRRVRDVALTFEEEPYCARCAPVCIACGNRAPESRTLDGVCIDCRTRPAVE